MASNRMSINGYNVTITGSTVGSVIVSGGTVYVNGEKMKDGLSGVIEIKWDGGPISRLECDANVTLLNGSVAGDVQAAGSVTCANVHGDVKAGGSVTCGQVEGNVKAGGSVICRR